MTVPTGSPQISAPESTIQTVKDNADRLGLKWAMKLATVVDGSDPAAVTAIYDNDTVAIAMTSMIGALSAGQRIYVIEVPPSGNFIVGFASGPYRARQTLATTAASVIFSGIPTALRSLRLLYTGRSDAGVNVVQVSLRINSDAGANYYAEYAQSRNTVLAGANLIAGTSGFCGLATGALASAGVYGSGAVDIQGWDSPHSLSLGYTFQAQALGATVVDFFAYFGGGIYAPAGPYRSLSLFAVGGNWISGSDFQLEGIPT